MLKKIRAFMDAFAAIVSTTLLILFYFTIFALFAIPLKLTTDFLKSRPKKSNYITAQRNYDSLEALTDEG